jgi:hypothetical protein|tara:strand:+ start:1214 stop:2272 length:1059 start_codon:yes stop_codon:yes gene_type:complete
MADALSGINEAILAIQTEYSMDMVSQVTVTVHDHQFVLARNNYFAIARTVWYRSWTLHELALHQTATIAGTRLWQRMEIASATMGPGPGIGAVWTLQLRPKGVQELKRCKTEGVIGGVGSAFVKNAARWAGLDSVVQYTNEAEAEWQAEGDDGAKESLWDVLVKVQGGSTPEGDPSKFMLFEADNVLWFGTQKWLLGRWGIKYDQNIALNTITPRDTRVGMNYIRVGWPSAISDSAESFDTFRLLDMPTATRSDNNPLEVTGSLMFDRFNARALRPGMTIALDMDRNEFGTTYFNGYYLISSVSFEHYGTGPVTVQFRSPERIAKDIPQISIGDQGDPRRNTSRRQLVLEPQ